MPNRKREEPVVRVTVGLDLSEHERLSRLAREAGVSLFDRSESVFGPTEIVLHPR
jgi:hypothetical protein